MSGSFLLLPPSPRDVHEANYQQAIEALGLKEASAEERIRVLLETPGEELIVKFPRPVSPMPSVDGDMVFTAPTYAQSADKNSNVPKGKAWCADLMVGDTQMDVRFQLTVQSFHRSNNILGKHPGGFTATH